MPPTETTANAKASLRAILLRPIGNLTIDLAR